VREIRLVGRELSVYKLAADRALRRQVHHSREYMIDDNIHHLRRFEGEKDPLRLTAQS